MSPEERDAIKVVGRWLKGIGDGAIMRHIKIVHGAAERCEQAERRAATAERDLAEAKETVREVLLAAEAHVEPTYRLGLRGSESHERLLSFVLAWRNAGRPGLTPPTESAEDRPVGSPEHVELWEAINDVVVASGGNAGNTSVARQKAVVRVEQAIEALVRRPPTESGTGEEDDDMVTCEGCDKRLPYDCAIAAPDDPIYLCARCVEPPHETVGEVLRMVDMLGRGARGGCESDVRRAFRAWAEAGKPGLPPPLTPTDPTESGTGEDWLRRSMQRARDEVAAWPKWKREAMRVTPEPTDTTPSDTPETSGEHEDDGLDGLEEALAELERTVPEVGEAAQRLGRVSREIVERARAVDAGPRRFYLHRDEDESGVSGTGTVAEGVCFSDGTAALRWRTQYRSTAVYNSMADVEAIHGHNGRTRVVWVDAARARLTGS